MNPPFLVIRPKHAFWVESRLPKNCTSTLQAFESGCFSETLWYDTTGGEWKVVEAKLGHPSSTRDRLVPWKKLAVVLRFAPRLDADLRKVLDSLRDVLHTGNEFCEYLNVPAPELWAQLRTASNVADVIAIVNRQIEVRPAAYLSGLRAGQFVRRWGCVALFLLFGLLLVWLFWSSSPAAG